MNRTALASSVVLTLALASGASADVLWDQSAISLTANSLPNHVTSSVGPGGQREAYGMADITVPAGGWTIDSISVYMGFWAIFVNGPANGAVLNIIPRTPGQPPSNSYNPRRPANGGSGVLIPAAQVITTNFTLSGQSIDQVTATGLNIVLAPGDYWIGLTPTYSGGSFGQPNQWGTTNQIGANQYYRGANLATMDAAWTSNQGDGAMLITGVPTPGAAALLGVAGLAAAGRRRSK
jgi:hypothetical protein